MEILYSVFIRLLLCIVSPMIIGIGLIVWLTSGFPVIFRQKRVGKNGKPFTMYKFRTMVVGAEKLKIKYSIYNEASGPAFKIRDDPRFTGVGKFLSHTGLDELPQLYNVLAGDMALFGPRPLPVAEEKKLKPWQRKRENIFPGIISPWILDGYHKNSFDAWMKSDISYIQNKSFSYDTGLFFQSFTFLSKLFFTTVAQTCRSRF